MNQKPLRYKLCKGLTPLLMATYVEKKMTLEQIASVYGVSKQRIHQILTKYKGSHPELFPEKKLDKSEVQRRIEEGESITSIAKSADMSHGIVSTFMRKNGIEKKTLKDRLSEDKLRELVCQGKTDKEIGDIYRAKELTIQALRYEYGIVKRIRKSKKGGEIN